ncbi:MAG: OB-fold nucleic acid binding domain-containing protein [Planctomycetota bacterium]|nr:OB-fold nucleic acid binding domain-containing protein [Planctomycetota bacterium]
MPLPDDLESLRAQAAAAFDAAQDAKALEAARVEFLGTRGKLKGMLGRMSEVPKEQKPVVGKRANEISAELQNLFDAAKTRVESSAPAAPASASSYEALKQERLAKLRRYEEEGKKLGLGSAWGSRFPDAASGKTLTSIERIREAFARLDKTKDTNPQAAAGEEVFVAARMMLRRDQSKKLIFLTVQDQTGTVQVALWNTMLKEPVLALLRETLDLWDIIGISGKLAFTQKGEPTVWATSARILSKCIAPPPDKHHGIHDKEIRYRQRYLDLIAEPQSRKTFILRAKAVAGMRRYLDEQGFLEMETPVLQTIPGGAAARPFETRLNALRIGDDYMKMYMRIATEIPLKKLLVGGLEKVYELGRIFRNEGIDTRHNPEFTTVEIYQAYADLRDMMLLTENLVSKLALDLTGSTTVTFRGKPIKLATPWPRLDYCELLKKYADVSPDDSNGLDRRLLDKKMDPAGLSTVEKIDGVFGEYVEEHLQDACFIINQPIEMSPLCKAHPQNPRLADRFEAFVAGMEIANAYTELNDPEEQRTRLSLQFKDLMREDVEELLRYLTSRPGEEVAETPTPENRALVDVVALAYGRIEHAQGLSARVAQHPVFAALKEKAVQWHGRFLHRGPLRPETEAFFLTVKDGDPRLGKLKRVKERVTDPSLTIDEDFLSALEHGMPPAGGLGIGVDRVMMLLAGVDSIRDVILFPLMRPE